MRAGRIDRDERALPGSQIAMAYKQVLIVKPVLADDVAVRIDPCCNSEDCVRKSIVVN
jgi:hypothetical protein